MASAAGEQNFGVLAHSQSMSNNTLTHIIEEFEQHLSVTSTQGQNAPSCAYNIDWISERIFEMDPDGLIDWIVAKETWSVPTVLTSSQNQFKWIVIKTTVNEQNVRLTYDDDGVEEEPLGTFKTRSLIVYIAEAEGLREILRNNVLPITDDILVILRHKST